MNADDEDLASSLPDSEALVDKDLLIERFLVADGRERRVLLEQLRPHLGPADLGRLAPVLRSATPKITARLVSLLARHGLREVFERQLPFMKPGRASLLRSQFTRMEKGSG